MPGRSSFADEMSPRPASEPGRKLRVFVSYSRVHEDWVEGKDPMGLPPEIQALAQLLRGKGVEVLLDVEILPGERWNDTLRDRLMQSDAAIICLSKAAVEKALWTDEDGRTSYFRKEIDAAEGRSRESAGRFTVIPLFFERCSIDRLPIKKYQAGILRRKQSPEPDEVFEGEDVAKLLQALRLAARRASGGLGEPIRIDWVEPFEWRALLWTAAAASSIPAAALWWWFARVAWFGDAWRVYLAAIPLLAGAAACGVVLWQRPAWWRVFCGLDRIHIGRHRSVWTAATAAVILVCAAASHFVYRRAILVVPGGRWVETRRGEHDHPYWFPLEGVMVSGAEEQSILVLMDPRGGFRFWAGPSGGTLPQALWSHVEPALETPPEINQSTADDEPGMWRRFQVVEAAGNTPDAAAEKACPGEAGGVVGVVEMGAGTVRILRLQPCP